MFSNIKSLIATVEKAFINNNIYIYICIIIGLIMVTGVVLSIIQFINEKKSRESAILLKITAGLDSPKYDEIEKITKYLHGLLLNTKIRRRIFGQPVISYEIKGQKDKIEFYVWVPEMYKQVLEEQIYLLYPNSLIEEIEEEHINGYEKLKEKTEYYLQMKKTDPLNPKLPEKIKRPKIEGMEVELGYNSVFPIASKIDITPSILSSMRNLEENQIITLQIVLKPLTRKWQVKARNLMKNYEKKGIRPESNGFKSLIEEGTRGIKEELNEELKELGIGSKDKGKNDLGKSDRREITFASEKILNSGFSTTIRILGVGYYQNDLKNKIRSIMAGFNKLDYINRFKKKAIINKKLFYKRIQKRKPIDEEKNVLTGEELANFFLSLPKKEFEMKEIEKNSLLQLPPPKEEFEEERNILGTIQYRNVDKTIGLHEKDFRRHLFAIGMTGSGKSRFGEGIARSKIDRFVKKLELKSMLESGEMKKEDLSKEEKELLKEIFTFFSFDPHGEMADNITGYVPKIARPYVKYYDLSDTVYPVPLNLLKLPKNSKKNKNEQIESVASEWINILKNNFESSWGPRSEKILMLTTIALLEADEGNVTKTIKFLKDPAFRKKVLKKVDSVIVKDFFEKEFVGSYDKNGNFKLKAEMDNSIQSPLTKLYKFLTGEIQCMLGQEDCIDFTEDVNQDGIIIVKIPKGKLKAENTKFLGNILFSKLTMAIMERTEEQRQHNVVIEMDEVQNFVASSAKQMEETFDEYRKYGCQMAVFCQRTKQVEPILSAITENIGTVVCFRVGQESSKIMGERFKGVLDNKNLEDLPNRYAYVKPQINGDQTTPVLIKTIDVFDTPEKEKQEALAEIKALNRRNRKTRDEILAEIKKIIKGDTDLVKKLEVLEDEKYIDFNEEVDPWGGDEDE